MVRPVSSQMYDIDDDGSPKVAPPLNSNVGATSQIWSDSSETWATDPRPFRYTVPGYFGVQETRLQSLSIS